MRECPGGALRLLPPAQGETNPLRYGADPSTRDRPAKRKNG